MANLLLSLPRARHALVAVAAVASLGTLAACGSDGAAGGDDRPLVLTSFTVLADMTSEVAGDRVQVRSITKPGAEIHGYEPTPSDLKNAARADLILENGLGLERWFKQFTERVDAPHATLSTGVKAIPIAGTGEYAGKPNPHAWMSPKNGEQYVENIRAALTKLDPAGEATFRTNAEAYKQELRTVGETMDTALKALPPGQRALVTCEGAFSYLARDHGLSEHYLWAVNAEQEATPQSIANVVKVVRRQQIPAVFCESTVSDKGQRQVASEAGSRFAGKLYVDSLSTADGPVPSYLELLRLDAATIVAGLTGRPLAEEQPKS